MLAPCASLPPHRWSPRGRTRGVGATCTAPATHGRPKRMTAPEYGKIGAGPTRRRRVSVRTASLASQRPVARGFASRSTGLAGHVRDYASSHEIQMTMRVFRGRVTGRPRLSRESEGGISRRVGRQPGDERTALKPGRGTVGPSSWHVRRLTPRPWERRMLQSG